MSTADIENRVEALEAKCSHLEKLLQQQPARDAWRGVVGMFADDPNIDKLHEETARIRAEDRKSTRGAR